MRQQSIISIILTAVFGVTFLIKHLYYPVLSGHTAYYFLSIFWICGILIAIIAIHMIWHMATVRRKSQPMEAPVFWPNRRRTYRIIYPDFARPILVIERADGLAKRDLEYPVVDLSQGGICFIDDGSLGSAESLNGYIRFENGTKITISGKLLRYIQNHISVELTRSIGWPVILKEQRRLMAILKPQK
jgi:hypothetical protein